MIKVDHLTKFYGSTLAVDNVSFDISSGQVVGFLGPNGAGKSTTMRMVTCYLKPTSGTASIAGYDINEHPTEVRKRIGYLPENCPLYTDMNVRDYLNFIAELRQVPSSKRKSQVDRMVDVTSLGGVMHKDIGELSKGYRQRVGLAQAMVHDPDILILDEPTTGLDPNQILEIRQLIKKIGREKTIILSTHIMQEVTATCGWVMIISGGGLVAQGTPDELTAQAQGRDVVTVSMKADAETAYGILREASFIENFRDLGASADEGWLELELTSAGGDIREQVFALAVEKGFPLRELHREKISLEEVFTKITTAQN